MSSAANSPPRRSQARSFRRRAARCLASRGSRFETLGFGPACVILAKEKDYFDARGTEEAFGRLKRLYRLLGAEQNVALSLGPTYHGYSQENREATLTAARSVARLAWLFEGVQTRPRDLVLRRLTVLGLLLHGFNAHEVGPPRDAASSDSHRDELTELEVISTVDGGTHEALDLDRDPLVGVHAPVRPPMGPDPRPHHLRLNDLLRTPAIELPQSERDQQRRNQSPAQKPGAELPAAAGALPRLPLFALRDSRVRPCLRHLHR